MEEHGQRIDAPVLGTTIAAMISPEPQARRGAATLSPPSDECPVARSPSGHAGVALQNRWRDGDDVGNMRRMAFPSDLDQARYAAMRWNTPLSVDHAALLVDQLELGPGVDVLDLGWVRASKNAVTSLEPPQQRLASIPERYGCSLPGSVSSGPSPSRRRRGHNVR